MKDFLKSTWLIIRDQMVDWFGFEFSWVNGLKNTAKEYLEEWKSQDSLGEKVGWLFITVIKLWLFWIIVIPFFFFFAEIAVAIEVMFAKLYLTIWLAILPFLLFFAILSFLSVFLSFFFEIPRFQKKCKFMKRLLYVVFLGFAFIADIYYHDQIESFLTDKPLNLEVTDDSQNNGS